MRIAKCGLAMILSATCALATAAEVSLVGLFPGKAVLVIDGGMPRTVAVGSSVGGVKLVSIEGNDAVIEEGGKRSRVSLGGGPVSALPSGGGGGGTISIMADERGHFITRGSINGASVTFMVDTGASSIAMGPAMAKRAGINYLAGEPGMANTANGVVETWHVRLSKVTIGDVTLNDVEGTVVQIDMPIVLLGMSFLNRMEMRREGSIMTLKRRC